MTEITKISQSSPKEHKTSNPKTLPKRLKYNLFKMSLFKFQSITITTTNKMIEIVPSAKSLMNALLNRITWTCITSTPVLC